LSAVGLTAIAVANVEALAGPEAAATGAEVVEPTAIDVGIPVSEAAAKCAYPTTGGELAQAG